MNKKELVETLKNVNIWNEDDEFERGFKAAMDVAAECAKQLEPLRIESHKGMSVYPNWYDEMNADLRNAKLDLINVKNNKGCQYCPMCGRKLGVAE